MHVISDVVQDLKLAMDERWLFYRLKIMIDLLAKNLLTVINLSPLLGEIPQSLMTHDWSPTAHFRGRARTQIALNKSASSSQPTLFFVYRAWQYLTLNNKQFREIKGLFHARFTGPSCRHSIENQWEGKTSGTAANPQIYRVSTEESPPNNVP